MREPNCAEPFALIETKIMTIKRAMKNFYSMIFLKLSEKALSIVYRFNCLSTRTNLQHNKIKIASNDKLTNKQNYDRQKKINEILKIN